MKKKSYPNIDNCNPLECISGKMMRCNRIIANIFRKHLKPFQITDSQLSILFYVTKAKMVTQKEIADFQRMEKSTVNRNIQRLKDNEYVSVDNKTIITTEKGMNLLEIVIPEWNNAMAEATKILDDSGINAINIIHQQLINNET